MSLLCAYIVIWFVKDTPELTFEPNTFQDFFFGSRLTHMH